MSTKCRHATESARKNICWLGEGNKKQDLKATFGDIKSECEILTLLNMHAPVFQDFTEGRSGIKSGA